MYFERVAYQYHGIIICDEKGFGLK